MGGVVREDEEGRVAPGVDEVVESLKEALSMIEKGLKEGSLPKATCGYLETLGRRIRDTLAVIELVGREDTIQSPLSSSGRGAMYNLRRAFYAVISRLEKEENVDRDRGVEEWRKAAGKIIDAINSAGISEAPTKIVLTYRIAEDGDVKYWKPESAEIMYFELEGILRITF